MTDSEILGYLRVQFERIHGRLDRLPEIIMRLGHVETNIADLGVQIAELSLRLDRFTRCGKHGGQINFIAEADRKSYLALHPDHGRPPRPMNEILKELRRLGLYKQGGDLQ